MSTNSALPPVDDCSAPCIVRAMRLPARRGKRGVALIITLAFVVLLTFAVVAFFTRATTDRSTENTSSGRVKADVLARGAVEAIINDLQQEITGTHNSTPLPSAANVSIYSPNSKQSMIPERTPMAATGSSKYTVKLSTTEANDANSYFNLIKQSINGQYLFTTGTGFVIARGSSSAYPSTDGRYVNYVRWSKPQLLGGVLPPGKNLGTSSLTSFPSDNSKCPDWVLVGRTTGIISAPLSNKISDYNNPGVVGTNLNPNYVIGRFAFNIYDEGGLLDINVLGSPSTTLTGSSLGMVQSTLAGKFAIGVNSGELTTAQLDAIIPGLGNPLGNLANFVDWRAGTAISTTGSFASSPTGAPYVNYALSSATTGFLKMYSDPKNPAISDNRLLTRQELIKLVSGSSQIGLTSGTRTLPFLTTFSRDLEQPMVMRTYSGDKTDPTYGNNYPLRTSATFGDTDTNQLLATAYSYNAGSDTAINPNFSDYPTTTGTYTGYPVVLRRFPLDRLAWITYKGPSATVFQTNPKDPIITALHAAGISDDAIKLGTDPNIKKYFGLSWTASAINSMPQAGYWTYSEANHTPAASIGGQIYRLSDVLANRPSSKITNDYEPDFFELLKASILAGSLGKPECSGTYNSSNPNATQAAIDRSVDCQVIQMGANIIDQFDADSFPTNIYYTPSNSSTGSHVGIKGATVAPTLIFHGVEDLPYFWEFRSRPVCTTKSIQISTPPGANITALAQSGSAVTTQGVMLVVPFVWNPHKPSTVAPSLSATTFRIWASASGTVSVPIRYDYAGYSLISSGVTTSGSAASAVQARERLNSIAQFPASPFPPKPPIHMLYTLSGTASILPQPSYPGMLFDMPVNSGTLYRLPTAISETNDLNTKLGNFRMQGVPPGGSQWPVQLPLSELGASGTGNRIGIPVATFPWKWAVVTGTSQPATYGPAYAFDTYGPGVSGTNPVKGLITFTLEYYPPGASATGAGVVFDTQTVDLSKIVILPSDKFGTKANPGSADNTYSQSQQIEGVLWQNTSHSYYAKPNTSPSLTFDDWGRWGVGTRFDPRTHRFGMLTDTIPDSGIPAASGTAGWSLPKNVFFTSRPSTGGTSALDPTLQFSADPSMDKGFANNSNGTLTSGTTLRMPVGPLTQNETGIVYVDSHTFPSAGYPQPAPGTARKIFYTDPDGIVRPAMGAYGGGSGGTGGAGLPMSSGSMAASAATVGILATNNVESRPVVLNRPFRSVGELGYVFRDTPWKNIDFSNPDSGDAALLDVFCLHSAPGENMTTSGPSQTAPVSDPVVAGRVNLNTRQAPVLGALIVGQLLDDTYNTTHAFQATNSAYSGVASAITALTTGTTAGYGPFRNRSELVGRLASASGSTFSYVGLSGSTKDIASTSPSRTLYTTGTSNFSSALSKLAYSVTTANMTPTSTTIQAGNLTRTREAAIRALADVGTVRSWNLMIDLVAQSGRLGPNATSVTNFIVEGETHYWYHVAIDRFTGKVIDRQLEVVNE